MASLQKVWNHVGPINDYNWAVYDEVLPVLARGVLLDATGVVVFLKSDGTTIQINNLLAGVIYNIPFMAIVAANTTVPEASILVLH